MSRSPSERWSHMHGGTGRQRRAGYQGKIAYQSWPRAFGRTLSLILWDVRCRRRISLRWPYACQWGSDYREGENARQHWHVGRRSH
jgi:hypothetical protein